MYINNYYYDCKYVDQMRDSQGWWDEHWILPEDKKKMIVFIVLMLFGCITIVGPVVSIFLFLLWLLCARHKRNLEYRNDVLRWTQMTVFKEYVLKYNFNPQNHNGWFRDVETNKAMDELLYAIKTVYGNKENK